jgi:hypothetical protein
MRLWLLRRPQTEPIALPRVSPHSPQSSIPVSTGRHAPSANRLLQDPQVIQRFADLGTAPVAIERATPKALQEHLLAEIARWQPVIKAAGVYAE